MSSIRAENTEFTVKESAITNLIIGVVFLGLSIIVLINIIHSENPGFNDYAARRLWYVLSITLLPAIVFIIKGCMHSTIITVNKDGFYYLGILKTNWQNFINAEMKEIPKTGSYTDNFQLFVRFYKDGENGYFETRIPMRNTFDRSGEEVVEAIKHFYEQVMN